MKRQWNKNLLLAIFHFALAFVFAENSRNPNLNFFGRSFGSLNNLSGVGRGQFNFDLTFNFPQPFLGLSRVRVNKNVADGSSIFLTDARSGFVNREARFAFDPLTNRFQTFTRLTDAFGRPVSGFVRGGLDSEAARQATTAFLQNRDFGDFNNLEKAFNGQVNVQNAFAAQQLAAEDLGPDGTNGILRVQCDKDVNGQPTDIIAGRMNYVDKEYKPNPAYLGTADEKKKGNAWVRRCKQLIGYTLNMMKEANRPPVMANQISVDENTGILTVRGLRNNFGLRNLSVLFGRSNNTDICNSDPFVPNPIWSTEGVVRRAADPNIYNIVKGYDPADYNRNFFVRGGFNSILPNQLQGRIGAARTDLFTIDNRQSGVATSNLSRQVEAYFQGGVSTVTTRDSNDRLSGNNLTSQQVRQTGVNNLDYRQQESYQQFRDGSIDWYLNAGPDKDGKLKEATEAPATAAHAGGKFGAVTTGLACMECHADGPAIFSKRGGPYDTVNVAGVSGIQNLSSNFSLIRAKWQGFLKMTGNYVENGEKPGQALAPAWDAYVNVNKPKSQDYVAAKLGYPPEALKALIANNEEVKRRIIGAGISPDLASLLQVDKDGDLDSKNLEAGGKCLIKKLLGDPRNYLRARPSQQPAPSSAPQGKSHQ